jgi:hypothetical protein
LLRPVIGPQVSLAVSGLWGLILYHRFSRHRPLTDRRHPDRVQFVDHV